MPKPYHKYLKKLARKLIVGGEIKAHNNNSKLKQELKKITRQLRRLETSAS